MHSAWFLASGLCLGVSLTKLATDGLPGWSILVLLGVILLIVGTALQYSKEEG